MPPRKRLGQILIELGLIDEHQLQSALGHQKQWGGKIGGILVQKGFCAEADVVKGLSQHLGMPVVRLAEVKIDPRAQKLVSRQVADKLHVFAYELTGSGRSEVVTIAMSDPTDLSAVDELAFHVGKRIKPLLCGDSEIVSAIQQHYPAEVAVAAPGATRPAGRPLPPLGPPPVMQPQKPSGADAAGGPPQGLGQAQGQTQRADAQPTAAGGPSPVQAPADSTPGRASAGTASSGLASGSAAMQDLETLAATAAAESSIGGVEAFQGGGDTGDVVQGIEPISDSTRDAGRGEGQGAAPSEAIGGYDGGNADGAMEGLEPIAAHAGPAAAEASAQGAREPLDPSSQPPVAVDSGWADAPAAAPASAETWEDIPVDDAPTDELPADAILGVAELASEDAVSGGVQAPAPGWDDAPAPAPDSGSESAAAPAGAPAAWDDAPAPAPDSSADVAAAAAAPAAWDDAPAPAPDSSSESAAAPAAAPAAWDDAPAPGADSSAEVAAAAAAPAAWDDAPAATFDSSAEAAAAAPAPAAWDDAPAATSDSSAEAAAAAPAPAAWDDAPAAASDSSAEAAAAAAAPAAWDDAPAVWDDAPAPDSGADAAAADSGADAAAGAATPAAWDDARAPQPEAPPVSTATDVDSAPSGWDDAPAPPPASDSAETAAAPAAWEEAPVLAPGESAPGSDFTGSGSDPGPAAAPSAWDDGPAVPEPPSEGAASRPEALDDASPAADSAGLAASPGEQGWEDAPVPADDHAARWRDALGPRPSSSAHESDTQPVFLASPSPWDSPEARSALDTATAEHPEAGQESSDRAAAFANGHEAPPQEVAAGLSDAGEPAGESMARAFADEAGFAPHAAARSAPEEEAPPPPPAGAAEDEAPGAWSEIQHPAGDEARSDPPEAPDGAQSAPAWELAQGTASFHEPDDVPAAAPAAGWLASSPLPGAAPASEAQDPSGETAPYSIPGWVAPPPDPVPEGAGWLGEALASSAPLSDVEMGTLRSAGIEPSDGAGALRLLAGLLRTLERRGVLDVSELANDVRAARVLSDDPMAQPEEAPSPAADGDQPG